MLLSPVAEERAVEHYLVAFAKIMTDKEDGISLQGVYFGGFCKDPDHAEQLARDCVNTIRHGTIIPKILPIDKPHAVMDALWEATEKFEKVTAYMAEADETLKRSARR
jgi:hypothetical protein